MVPDWETNCVFLSTTLQKRCPELLSELRASLMGVRLFTVRETRDIWCRDYMPIQLGEGTFCQLVYNPTTHRAERI